MTTRELLTFAPLLALLCWAAAVDVRTRRIPNWLTGALALGGLAQVLVARAAWAPAPPSPGEAVLGLLAGFGLGFVLFALRAMGGGDVKLLAAVGAWVGPAGVLQVFATAAVAGMVIAVAQAVAARRAGALFRGTALVLLRAATTGDLANDEPEPAGPGGGAGAGRAPAARQRLPYAVPVFIATAAVLLLGAGR